MTSTADFNWRWLNNDLVVVVLVATCAAVLAVLLAKELLCELVLILVVVDIAADVLEGEELVQGVHVGGACYLV